MPHLKYAPLTQCIITDTVTSSTSSATHSGTVLKKTNKKRTFTLLANADPAILQILLSVHEIRRRYVAVHLRPYDAALRRIGNTPHQNYHWKYLPRHALKMDSTSIKYQTTPLTHNPAHSPSDSKICNTYAAPHAQLPHPRTLQRQHPRSRPPTGAPPL